MVNRAINETLSRTFITSGTVFIATIVLYVFGGAGIHAFAYAMLIGVISGTYSTIFIAAPIVLFFKPPTAVLGGQRSVESVTTASAR
jgi:preprotein translocase subunit SecF